MENQGRLMKEMCGEIQEKFIRDVLNEVKSLGKKNSPQEKKKQEVLDKRKIEIILHLMMNLHLHHQVEKEAYEDEKSLKRKATPKQIEKERERSLAKNRTNRPWQGTGWESVEGGGWTPEDDDEETDVLVDKQKSLKRKSIPNKKEQKIILDDLERAFEEDDINQLKNVANHPHELNPEGYLDVLIEERNANKKLSSYKKLKQKFDTNLQGMKKLFKAMNKLASINGISLGFKSIHTKAKKNPQRIKQQLRKGREYLEKLDNDYRTPPPEGSNLHDCVNYVRNYDKSRRSIIHELVDLNNELGD